MGGGGGGVGESEGIEDELAVGASFEFELELMRERAERSVVDLTGPSSSTSLIAVFLPLVLSVVQQPHRYPHERLQVTATLTLCTLMMTSSAPVLCSSPSPLHCVEAEYISHRSRQPHHSPL